MISYISMESFSETAFRWLKVHLEKLKHKALSANSVQSGSVGVGHSLTSQTTFTSALGVLHYQHAERTSGDSGQS
jgi:hypothetical protein